MAGLGHVIRSAATFDRQRLERLADGLAVALAVSLPWSTSATGILAVLWLIAVIPTIDVAAWRRVLPTASGGLPVLLCALGLIGILWANGIPMADRWDGFKSFLKLLAIPVLIAQYSRSERGAWLMIGFIASCVVLMAVSWALVLVPALVSLWPRGLFGIPVKDYIAQSGEFTVCAFLLGRLALEASWEGRSPRALALALLGLLFLANILYVFPSRTALVVILVLLMLFAYRHFAWKGMAGLLLAALLAAVLAWSVSPMLRWNVDGLINEVQGFNREGAGTRAGERIEFWKRSVQFVAEAPLAGHGTGSIPQLFRKSAAGQSGMAGLASSNPHNQTLAVAIQLGLLGTAVLFAMWIAHLLLFRGDDFLAWAGLVIVAQNLIGSLFNSHLFDFTQGWGYVIGVGVAAGMVFQRPAVGPDGPSYRP